MPEKLPEHDRERPAARAFWSGTITFGLVNIPVDLFAAVRARRTSMKMVDAQGQPLGRAYYCPEDDKALSDAEIVRGYETDDGEMIVVTDEELDSVAPEMTRDIELRRFVPLAQIPPAFFQRPYFLAPSGRSTKAYHLLARTMERTGRVGIGTFVMRGRQYLVAVLSEGGVLRASTLRFADEIRSPADVGLPDRPKVDEKQVKAFAKEITAHKARAVDEDELTDRYAEELRKLAQAKEEKGKDVVDTSGAAEDEDEEEAGGAEVIDLVALLKKRLAAKDVAVTAPRGRKESSEREAAPHKNSDARDVAPQKTGRDRKSAAAAAAPARKAASRHAGRGAATPAKKRGKAEAPASDDASREDLYERAKALDIPGRSKMSKQQLAKAIAAAAR